MKFIGCEPFRPLMDLELRVGNVTYDLHTTAWVRAINIDPLNGVLEICWTIEDPPEANYRQVTATVTVRLEQVERLELEGLFRHVKQLGPDGLQFDGFFWFPEQNGPRWLELKFGNNARIELVADRCVASVQT